MPSTTPTSYATPSCAHERGPGTSVCLRCRAEAHASAAGRRRRLAAQLGAAVAIVVVVVGIAEGAITARHGTVGGSAAAAPHTARANVITQGEPVAAATAHKAAALTPATKAPESGRTELGAGLYVDHDAADTRVHFDTERTRTRRRDKFEAIVRQTLPKLYGERADSILAALPEGEMAREGDLLEDLPRSGIHLPPRNGWSITVWPETRPGRDGPLVVSYRVAISSAN